MTIGSMRHARANEPASPERCWYRTTHTVKMNSPITIEGTPAITSERNRITRASRLVPPYSVR